MKQLMSNILVNWPARYLSSRTYLTLVVLYSWTLRALGNRTALKKFHFEKLNSEVELYFFDKTRWRIINPVRANRYMKGVIHAGERLLIRYGIGKVPELPKSFVDVGANVGELSYWFAKNGIAVQCFEPDPQVFRILQSNLENCSNVSLFNVALSDFDGKAQFAVQSSSADSSLIFQGSNLDLIDVDVCRYENHEASKLLEVPAFLKMDTEGNEPESLLGFGKFLSSFNLVAIDAGAERLGKDTKRETTEILAASGFKIDANETSLMVVGRRPVGVA